MIAKYDKLLKKLEKIESIDIDIDIEKIHQCYEKILRTFISDIAVNKLTPKEIAIISKLLDKKIVKKYKISQVWFA